MAGSGNCRLGEGCAFTLQDLFCHTSALSALCGCDNKAPLPLQSWRSKRTMCPTIWNKRWATSHLLWKPRRCCVCSLSLRSGGHRVDVVAAMQQWEVPNREATRQHHLWQPSLSPIVNLYWQKTSAHALCEDTPPLIPPCSTFQQVWISHCRKDKARVLSRVTRDPSSKYLAFRKKARVCVVT